jgi:hypothetical protein
MYSTMRFTNVGAPPTRIVMAVNLRAVDERRSTQPIEGANTVHIASDAAEVRFVVPLAGTIDTAEDLEIDLIHDSGRVDTRERWKVSRTANASALMLTVPASQIPDGDYTLSVRRRGAAGPDLAAHAFRVSRQ